MSRPRLGFLVPIVLFSALFVSAACSSSEGGEGGGLRVVATTPLLAEFASRIAGDDASVGALIPMGVDLHSWQPSTTSARDVAEADVLIVNGYGLEEGLLGIVTQNARAGASIVTAADGLPALEGGHDHDHDEHEDHEEGDHEEGDHEDENHGDEDHDEAGHDPHLWLSVPNAIGYVENIRDALVAADATHASGYEERAGELIAELEALNAEVRSGLAAIPEGGRTIVAFHDAYRYLAAEYGLEVVASVAPSNPNQATSAQAIAEIVELVRTLGLTAVFKEPQFSAQSLDLIAQESGARVLVLRSTLTEDTPTYAEMMRANVAALVDGLAR